MRKRVLYALNFITIVIVGATAELSARNMPGHVNGNNEADSLSRDTLIDIRITKDSVEAEPRAGSIVIRQGRKSGNNSH